MEMKKKRKKKRKSCTCAAAAAGQTLVKHSRIHAALFPGLLITQQRLLKVKGRRCFPATIRAPSPDRQHNRLWRNSSRGARMRRWE